MRLSSIGTRWAAWGLLAATFAMGVSLLVTSWASYRGAISASAAITRSQGDTFLRGLFALGRRSGGGNVPQAELQAFLEEQRPAGLQYAALFDEAQQRVVEAGTAIGGPADARPAETPAASRDVELQPLGARVRLVARPPAPPPESAGAGGSRRGGPPTITLEYEPILAGQLAAEAGRTLRWSAAVAALLLLVAALFARLLLEREAAEGRFEEQRRLAALGEMSSVLAHELRNPLASLKGHAQLLLERLPAGREHAKAETIVLEAQRLEALSADLLDFSRSGPIARRDVEPGSLLRSVAGAVDGGRVRVSDAGAPARWPLDESRTRQASDQPAHERARGLAGRGAGGSRRRAARRAPRVHGARPRRRAAARPGAQAVRAVLHHAREGHRARPRGGAAHRRDARRHAARLEPPRGRRAVRGRAAEGLRMPRILVVDDEEGVRSFLAEALEDEGHAVEPGGRRPRGRGAPAPAGLRPPDHRPAMPGHGRHRAGAPRARASSPRWRSSSSPRTARSRPRSRR